MDIQAAIAAACDPSTGGGGGVVHVPAGIYLLGAGIVFPGNDNPNLNAQVTLQGDGINSTVIYTNTPNLDLVTIARSHVSIKGIYFQGSQQQGVGRGIVLSDPRNGKVLNNIHLEDVYVAATEREALYAPNGFPHLLSQAAYDRISVIVSYHRCWFDSNLTPGSDLAYLGRWNTTHRFTQCQFTNFKGRALYLYGADGTSCRDCIFEAGDNSRPYVEGVGATSTLLDHCWMEDHATSSPLAVFTKHDKASTGWVERDLIQRRA